MKQNNYLTLVLFSLILVINSCVETYNISEQIEFKPTLVVDGTITDQSENQEITLSMSVGIQDNFIEDLPNYNVKVQDKDGNEYMFNNNGHNKYIGIIPFNKLVPGNAFKVIISSPDGELFESGFEEMTRCVDIDSIYYEFISSKYNENTQTTSMGIQYYVDLKVDKQYSKFYRWRLIETYEYHATWPIEKYWIGEWVNNGISYARFVCYKTEQIKGTFAVSAEYVQNEYLKYPLAFIDNRTQRLYYKYSLLVEQYSITKNAYHYWELLKSNSQENGSIFDKQPTSLEGNIKCISNPKIKVLGYFGVSSVKTKRVFAQDITEMEFSNLFCAPDIIKRMGDVYQSTSAEWPIYIVPGTNNQTAAQTCFDCTKSGGKVTKPDFWDKK